MGRIVDNYATDLCAFDAGGASLAEAPLPIFFRAIASIPYREDTEGIEVVTRPYVLLTAPLRGWDCKKKAIAIASWLKLHHIPYRFAATSRRPSGEIHHVVVQAWIDGEWVEIDATYPQNQLFERQAWTKVEPLSGNGRASTQPVLVSMAGDGAPGPALTWEFNQAIARAYPEYMGQAESAAGVVAGVVVAIVAALTAITVAIVQAVSAKREGERADRRQADLVQSYADIAATNAAASQQAADDAADQAAATQANQYDMIKKWILPASLAAGALLLFR
jgi:hypothetical protein